MMPPDAFTVARLAAPHFIQARVLGWNGRLDVRVTRAFRGGLKRGTRLSLSVNVAHDGPIAFDSTLWVDPGMVAAARYVEAFLGGDPPDVVWDQIKFLRIAGWRPSGDPAKVAFIW